MAAIVPITILDEGIVDLVLNPQQIQGNVATFMDTRGGVPLGFPRLTASLTRPSKGVRNSRVRLRLEIPKLETVAEGEAPVYGYANFADFTFTFSDRSTVAERQELVAAMANMIVNVDEIVDLVEDLEMLY